MVQTALVSLSVQHGLGRHFNTLSDEDATGYHKVSVLHPELYSYRI